MHESKAVLLAVAGVLVLLAAPQVTRSLAVADAAQSGQIPYILRGKLAGGMTGTTRFIDQGTLSLSSLGAGSR